VVGSWQNTLSEKQIRPRVKVWLEADQQYVFGFGISEILKAIERSGSIKAAAVLLGKSYRYVWARVKKAEGALGQPLVETRVGGKGTSRSSLTELAGRLVTDYDALRRRMFEVVEEEFSSRFGTPPNLKSPHHP
jgi:molybdate transport system regulatory protein